VTTDTHVQCDAREKELERERDRYRAWLQAIEAQPPFPVNRPQNMATKALNGEDPPSSGSGGVQIPLSQCVPCMSCLGMRRENCKDYPNHQHEWCDCQ
jgi:hypothetical protein